MGVDVSDYNSLKNQRDTGRMIREIKDKNKNKPKIIATETQKYYEYLTYAQPILDEINYIAEKQKTEDINKQKTDYEFLEKVKTQKEDFMKQEEANKITMRSDLFDYPLIDLTPTIITDTELEFTKEEKSALKIEKGIINKIRRIRAKKELEGMKKIKAEEAKRDDINKAFEKAMEDTKKEQASNLLKAVIKRAETQNKKELNQIALKKYEEDLNKYGISRDISNTMNRPIIKEAKTPSKNEKAKELFTNITANLPIKSDLQTETRLANIPRNKRGAGRPKGSKNKPKSMEEIVFKQEARSLDLTGSNPVVGKKKK